MTWGYSFSEAYAALKFSRSRTLFTVTSLALVPGNPATLFAATGGGGLLTSTDGGGSWAVVDKSLADTYVSSVIVDPTNSSTLYAGTDHPYDGTHSERLYKSTNGGVTWLQTSLDAQGNSVDIIAVHPVNPSTVYAASHGTGGLFQSLDGGTTWTTLTTDSACGGVNAILFNASGSTMYLAGTTGVCRSTDGAQTWTLSPVANLASVQALCFDPLDPSILYAGALPLTATGTGGVFASFDGGMTWSAFGSGLPASIAVTTLAVDGKTGTLYAGTQGSGVATLLLLASRPRIDAPAQTHKTLTLPQR